MNIKLLTAYQGDCPYRELTLANFSEYCNRWGHQLVVRFGHWLPEEELLSEFRREYVGAAASIVSSGQFDLYPENVKRKIPLSWAKHYLIGGQLRDCDWLVWLDPDCKIMDMTVPLESFLDDTFDLALPGRFPECPVHGPPVPRCRHAPKDYETLSLGVMLIRNCAWSTRVLFDWGRSKVTDWYGERPFHCRMLGDNHWFSCKFMLEDPRRERVKVLDREKIGYVHRRPGQFIIHLYGSLEADRARVLRGLEAEVIR